MRVCKGKELCVFVTTSAATHHAQRSHREEQLLDAAIIPVAGSILSSSAAVACWVTNGALTLRYGINLSNQGDLLYNLRRGRAADQVLETWGAAL